MIIRIHRDYEAMSVAAAKIVAELVRHKPNAVLGLATGSTPLGLYQALVKMHGEDGLDFSAVTTFNLDEYNGLAARHSQSYHQFMAQHLFKPLGLKQTQTNLLDGTAKDAAAECAAYEKKIRAAGGIDLQVLGIGGDGHIAFCEPGSSLAGRTRLIALHPKTIADNARFFKDPAEVPRRALTMGVGTILEAKVCLILASGPGKAAIWARMVEGAVTAQVTASALQLHPWTIAVCDIAAASKLENLAHYLHVDEELADQPVLPRELMVNSARAAAPNPAPRARKPRSRRGKD